MWRKATYYRSTSFAALVVGSSIALLTGAQAATLDFGPGSPSGLASRGGQQAIIVSLPNASAPSPQITTGPASFGALSGTFAFGTAASSFAPQPTLRYTQAWNPAGGGNFNVGSTVFPIFTASFDGGADTLRGNVNLFLGQASLVGGSADQAILNGTFTLTNAVGSPDFLSSLPAINSTTPFSWTLNGDGVTSLAALQMMPIGTLPLSP